MRVYRFLSAGWLPKALCLAGAVCVASCADTKEMIEREAAKPGWPAFPDEYRGPSAEDVSYGMGSNPNNDFGAPE